MLYEYTSKEIKTVLNGVFQFILYEYKHDVNVRRTWKVPSPRESNSSVKCSDSSSKPIEQFSVSFKGPFF